MIYDDENFFYKCLQTHTHTTKSPPRTHPFTILTHSKKKNTLVCLSVCLCVYVCLCVRVKMEKGRTFRWSAFERIAIRTPHKLCTMFHKRERDDFGVWWWWFLIIWWWWWWWCSVLYLIETPIFPVLLLKQNKWDVKWSGRVRRNKQLVKFSVLLSDGEKVHVFI